MSAERRPHGADEVATAAQLACLLEASAIKPGNVFPGRPFADTTYEHFLASAAAIGPAFTRAGEASVGSTIRDAVEATSRWVPRNTNLGIVLLLAPLARAARASGGSLRERVTRVLDRTTVEDARDTFAAIRRAAPGGLGDTDAQDVHAEPTVSLLAAMRLAAHRDVIAREWATSFAITFAIGAPAVARARTDGLSWSDAVTESYLSMLSQVVDTHIARKCGLAEAERVRDRARDVVHVGGVRTEGGRAAIRALDEELRDARNSRNPGSSADLTAAAIFVTLLDDGWA
jgi:triphosphoribosyl-dephospho-CoA synthase